MKRIVIPAILCVVSGLIGAALTVRCVPANRPMWKLNTTEEIVGAHGAWFKEMGSVRFNHLIQPGHVVVTNTGGAREVGFWGSENALNVIAAGGVGIITDGCCRDTPEIAFPPDGGTAAAGSGEPLICVDADPAGAKSRTARMGGQE
jgi:hypothetical protein